MYPDIPQITHEKQLLWRVCSIPGLHDPPWVPEKYFKKKTKPVFQATNIKYAAHASCILQPAEELQFVWCELLSEALAALWTSSVTSAPDLWLKWDPLRSESQPAPKQHHGADNMVLGLNNSC